MHVKNVKNAEVKCIFAEVNPFYLSNFFAVAIFLLARAETI